MGAGRWPGTTCLALALALCSLAQAAEYSPAVHQDIPRRVFWGDTHVHTNLSTDAFSMGNRTLGPEQAYRFARGETLTSQTGVRARLAQPLDFLMVADHGAFLGVMPKLYQRSPVLLNTRFGQHMIRYIDSGEDFLVLKDFAILAMGLGQVQNPEDYVDEAHGVTLDYLHSLRGLELEAPVQRALWKEVGAVADAFNEPGLFTAFIGYEWTSTPDGNNLHRNVMFRDGSDRTSSVLPFTSMDSGDPEALWQYMAEYEATTGGAVLAIPHNGNLSNGLMFAEETLAGEPIDRDYARRRARWEPIIEVTQIKGDGETHPYLSPDDEFADFENWDQFNLFASAAKTSEMLKHEYARQALRNGLALQQSLGANPFKFGMIGSTDSHTSLATAAEDNFFGKQSGNEPERGRMARPFTTGELESPVFNWMLSSSGYAAVWARENTREALFDAIRRRETYATTGPRIAVRLFAGWEFEPGDEQRAAFVEFGYQHGVPMGGELVFRPEVDAPRFMVSAMKDPQGANLDRVQIIKAWVDPEGVTHERIYNVAASAGRTIRDNRLASVGTTIDERKAEYLNSIGAVELATVWQDPDFDPGQHAAYYARVLEIPTPRWTNYDAVRFDEPVPAGAPKFVQERAYTSPVWYTPRDTAVR